MKKYKFFIFIFIIGFILISCSSLNTKNTSTTSDDNIMVSYNIEGLELKEFEIEIKNYSEKEVLLLITEAKVLTADGDFVNIMRVKDALSKENSVQVKNIKLKPGAVLKENFVAVGYLRKQILKNEFVLLPWLEQDKFELSLPYIIDGRKYLIEIIF